MTQAYQSFAVPYPRFPLATFPSPLERAARLETALRGEARVRVPRLYLKRDDTLSLGLGGNKVRSLEFSIGEALELGATDIVTSGRQQSNHCRLMATACARAGLRAHLVFSGARPKALTGNLLLDHLLGATMHFSGSDDRALRAALVGDIVRSIESGGGRPHVIPVGGSDPRGAIGHALLAAELVQQVDAVHERLGAIALASATGGTQAGLLAGLRRLGVEAPVHGLTVAKKADDLRSDIQRIAGEVASAIDAPPVAPGSVLLDDTALGGGYGVPTHEAQRALSLLARTEGILADPTYTAKALAGLLALVRDGRFSAYQAVVFIHTGGAPALFAAGATLSPADET